MERGSTFDDVLEVALELEGVREVMRYGCLSLLVGKSNGRTFVRLEESCDVVSLPVAPEVVEPLRRAAALVSEQPAGAQRWVTLRLDEIPPEWLKDLVRAAHALSRPKKKVRR